VGLALVAAAIFLVAGWPAAAAARDPGEPGRLPPPGDPAFVIDIAGGYPVAIVPGSHESRYVGVATAAIRHGVQVYRFRFGMAVQPYWLQNRVEDSRVTIVSWGLPFHVAFYLADRPRFRLPWTFQVGPAFVRVPGAEGHGGGALYSTDLQARITVAHSGKFALVLAPTVEFGRIGRRPQIEIGGVTFVAARLALSMELGR
jgi:hypothetical protein